MQEFGVSFAIKAYMLTAFGAVEYLFGLVCLVSGQYSA